MLVCLSDLLAEHLQEIRALRQRLEESIRTNDHLREQLERRLAEVDKDPGMFDVCYICEELVVTFCTESENVCSVPTCLCCYFLTDECMYVPVFSSYQHLHPWQRGAGSAGQRGAIPLGTKPSPEGAAQRGVQR